QTQGLHGNDRGHGLPAFGKHGAHEAHTCDSLVYLGVSHLKDCLELWPSPAAREGAPHSVVLRLSQIRKRSTTLDHPCTEFVHLFPRAPTWSG
ncbi:MAG: hypothetical protein ACREMY_10310, partial [bacterium]